MAAQATSSAPVNANLWVLDFLLEADGLDDTLIKHFHDVNANQFEELPPTTQARLMLRVLKDAPLQPTGVAEAALGALNMLKNLALRLAEKFGPAANMEPLKPSEDLFIAVKTELVLKCLRDPNQSEHPRVVMDRFFVPDQENLMLTPAEMARRNEIVEGLKGQEEIQNLLNRHPIANLNNQLLSFVFIARSALGPNLLKIVEKDIIEGRYNPQVVPPPQGAKRRRKTHATGDEDPNGVLANMNQSGATLAGTGGQDPLADARLAAQQAGRMEGSGEGEAGIPGGEAKDGTQGPGQNSDTPSGYRRPPGPAPRRRNGRWNEEETNFLIVKVREFGKGKWKKILELGGHIFQNRSQVDLKDKWRNLERQGVVGPHDLPPQPQLAGQIQLGIPQGLNQGLGHSHVSMGPDGQLLGPILSANGEPLNETAAQHYVAFAAQYAAQMAGANQQAQTDAGQAHRGGIYGRPDDQSQQQLTPELLQQLAQASHLPAHSLQQITDQLHHNPDQHLHHPQQIQHQGQDQPHPQTPQNAPHLQADASVIQPPGMDQQDVPHDQHIHQASLQPPTTQEEVKLEDASAAADKG